jgi:hypothetical protein
MALARANGRYSLAGARRAVAAITLAAAKRPPKIGYIDCKTFPNSITCNECNATGPGTFNCCQVFERADACIINNDPNAPGLQVPPGRGNFFSNRADLINSVRL